MVSTALSALMKYLIIILVIALALVGYKAFQPELKFYPEGDIGTQIPYFTDLAMAECDICGEGSMLFKVDSKHRKVCNKCYLYKFKYR